MSKGPPSKVAPSNRTAFNPRCRRGFPAYNHSPPGGCRSGRYAADDNPFPTLNSFPRMVVADLHLDLARLRSAAGMRITRVIPLMMNCG